jgi:hypothetical protein
MKVRVFLLSFLLSAAALSFAADPRLTDRQFAPILKYYSDCTWVAANGSPAEIARIVTTLDQRARPRTGVFDLSGRKLLLAIEATRGVILNPDPGILGFTPVTIQYDFKVTPLEIVANEKDAVSIRVTRQSTRLLAQPARPAAAGTQFSGESWTPGGYYAAGDRPLVVTEIDEWVRVGNAWRLKAIHAYLI